MTLCATAALYCVVRYVENGRLSWLLACGSMMGAAILSKETSVVLLGGLYVFFALTPAARLRVRHLALAVAADGGRGGDLAGHAAAGRALASTGQSYLLWQLFRRPNHGTWFYFTVLPAGSARPLLAAALAGLIWLRREATWRERLLLSWIVVPVLFFTLWPVKGFQYLLPVAPVAGRPGRPDPGPPCSPASAAAGQLARRRPRRAAMGVLAAATVVSLAIPAWARSRAFRQRHLPGRERRDDRRPGGRRVDPAARSARAAGCWPSARPPPTCWSSMVTTRSRPCRSAPNPRDRNPVLRPGGQPRPGAAPGVSSSTSSGMPTPPPARPSSPAKARRLASKYHGVAVYTATINVPALRAAPSRAGLHHLRGAPMKAQVRLPRPAGSPSLAVLLAWRRPAAAAPAPPASPARTTGHADQALHLPHAGRPDLRQLLRHLSRCRRDPPPGTCQPRSPASPADGCVKPFLLSGGQPPPLGASKHDHRQPVQPREDGRLRRRLPAAGPRRVTGDGLLRPA